MKLHSVEISNLRTHAHSVIDFPATGIVGLVGNNGAGKSSVIEAIAWCLYGTRAIRGSKGSLRWNRAPSTRKATVSLEIEVAGSRYVIERDETTASVRQAGALQLLASGTSAVDAYVPELIGMSLEEFASTFLCEQKSIDRIASMKPAERRTFVRDVMQIGRIDTALAACRERKNALARERAAIQEGLGDRAPLVAERDAAKAAVVEADNSLHAAQEAARAASQAAADAAEALQALTATKARHDEAEAALADAKRTQAAADQEHTRLQKALFEAEAAAERVRKADERLATLQPLRERKEQLATAKARQGERASLQQLLTSAETDSQKYATDLAVLDDVIEQYDAGAHEVARNARRAVVERVNDIVARRQQARAAAEAEANAAGKDAALTDRRLAELQKQGPDGACPTCTRKLGEQLALVLRTLADHALALRATETAARARVTELGVAGDDELEADAIYEAAHAELVRLDQLARDAATAERQRPNLVAHLESARRSANERREQLAAMPVVEYSERLLQDVAEEITALEQLEKSIAPLRGDAGKVGDLEQQVREAHQTLQAARTAVQERALMVVAIEYDAQDYDQADEAAARLRDYREEAKTTLARAEGAAAAAGERRTRAEGALVDYDGRAGKLNTLLEQLRTHELAAGRLDEFRDEQVQLLRPELEMLVSGFVSILTDGRHESVTVDDDFNVVLQESGIDMEITSGGTQDVAAIALRLAISQMIAERAGHPLSLLILDEPFGSLSEVRRTNVLNLIRQLADTFPQVLLISHIEETRESVDHVIQVVFDEAKGCSVVTQESATPAAEPQLAEAAA